MAVSISLHLYPLLSIHLIFPITFSVFILINPKFVNIYYKLIEVLADSFAANYNLMERIVLILENLCDSGRRIGGRP